MDYKRIYEAQYGKKRLIEQKQLNFFGLRKIFRFWDLNRYDITYKLIYRGKRVLDIGCGNGYMLFRLIDRYNEFYGLDISSSRIKESRKIVSEKFFSKSKKFNFYEGDLNEELNFKSNFFDTIICLAVLEHVYDIYLLIREIYRVLKTGGYVIVEVPNIAYLKYRAKLLFGQLPVTSSPYNWDEIGYDGGHIHYFTMKKLCELFESQGFKIIKKVGSGFLAPLRNWWPSLLSGDLIIKAMKPILRE